MDKIEHKLRYLLWLHHGCDQGCLYGDDGEMQCSNHPIPVLFIDFKRDSPSLIQWKLASDDYRAMISRPKEDENITSPSLEECLLDEEEQEILAGEIRAILHENYILKPKGMSDEDCKIHDIISRFIVALEYRIMPIIRADEREKVLKEIEPIIDGLLNMIDNADFSNGVVSFGVDEGKVGAWKMLQELKTKWNELK